MLILNFSKRTWKWLKRTFSKQVTFNQIRNNKCIFLYAGDVPDLPYYKKYVGLSLSQSNRNHILHNILKRHELDENTVDVYQAEDVIEYIPYIILPDILNDIYRILKPGGYLRLSIPDYACDVLLNRSLKDPLGNILFDPEGGGSFSNGKVVGFGHLWFPTYKLVLDLLKKSNFKKLEFYHYYDEKGNPVTHKIDYSKGFVQRTPDNDKRVQNPYRPMSIVVDCIK